jgi:hypothetical protein
MARREVRTTFASRFTCYSLQHVTARTVAAVALIRLVLRGGKISQLDYYLIFSIFIELIETR